MGDIVNTIVILLCLVIIFTCHIYVMLLCEGRNKPMVLMYLIWSLCMIILLVFIITNECL